MLAFKLAMVFCEGLIFGILAFGVLVAFSWLRFPDLTPDGSFALGAATYVKTVLFGAPTWVGLGFAFGAGAIAGSMTALINRVAKVPTVVAGLLVSSALYSIIWLLLGKPNQFLKQSLTLVGSEQTEAGILQLLVVLIVIAATLTLCLSLLAESVWGLRLRAIGENPLLAKDLGASETAYTFFGLMLANALVGFAGALFVQRSFSADINMGLGMTITGLAGTVLGLLVAGAQPRSWILMASVLLGAILYKSVIFIALELGMPAESFRLLSASVLLFTFVLFRYSPIEFLRALKWN